MEYKTVKEFLTSAELGFFTSALIFVIIIVSIPMESNFFLNPELQGTNAHMIYSWTYYAFISINLIFVLFRPSLREFKNVGDGIGTIFLIILGPFSLIAVTYSFLWKRYYYKKQIKYER